jgi:hypothetical protein
VDGKSQYDVFGNNTRIIAKGIDGPNGVAYQQRIHSCVLVSSLSTAKESQIEWRLIKVNYWPSHAFPSLNAQTLPASKLSATVEMCKSVVVLFIEALAGKGAAFRFIV